MRSVVARLSLAGIVAFALAGCSTSSTPLSSGGIPNSSGGGSVPGTGGVGALPVCSLTPIMLDNGNAENNAGSGPTYVPINAELTDTQGVGDPTGNDPLTGSGWDAPSCVPAEPNIPTLSPPGPGFHDLILGGSGTTQIIIKNTNTPIANLTYQYHGYYFNYTAIVLHMSYPAVSSLPQPSSISIELAGSGATPTYTGALASTYDVRSPCTEYPSGGLLQEPFWSTLVCPINGGATGYGTNKNTQGPNAVVPGAAGAFTPIAPTLFIVFNYGKATNESQGTSPFVTYMYAYQ
jgi:hypothetical protein